MKRVLEVILVVLLILVATFVSINNRMGLKYQDVKLQESQIETTLQRRADLIPNLVATVKGYATHEEKVLTEIANARAMLLGCLEDHDFEGTQISNEALDSAIGRLIAISESYPELKANEQFIDLQDELAGTENRIAVARQYYNEAVKKYNDAICKFPASIFAKLGGYKPIEYFKASSGADNVPTVTFN